MTKEDVLTYLEGLDSRRAVNRLEIALTRENLIPVQEAVAGGGNNALKKRVGANPQWDESAADRAFELYVRMIDRDLLISVFSAYAFLTLIIGFAALIALIIYQVTSGQFSAKQLSGVPLAAFCAYLFKAYRHERANHASLRRDLLKAKNLFIAKPNRSTPRRADAGTR